MEDHYWMCLDSPLAGLPWPWPARATMTGMAALLDVADRMATALLQVTECSGTRPAHWDDDGGESIRIAGAPHQGGG